jgi:hypothetical protein
MLKSTYDPNQNNVVDNSEQLEGSTKSQVQDHAPKFHGNEAHCPEFLIEEVDPTVDSSLKGVTLPQVQDHAPKTHSHTEYATQEYVVSRLQGLDWQESVLDKDLTVPPSSPTLGDRYIVAVGGTGAWNGHNNNIAEWNGSLWVFAVPDEGSACWIEDEDINYEWNGTTWIKLGSTVDHGNLLGLGDDDHTQYLNTTRHDTTDRHTLGSVVPHDVLASLTEKTHASLTNVGENDHHTKFTITEHDVTARHTLGTVVPHDSLASLTAKSHTSLTDIGSNSHTAIDSHIASTANPHATTKVQVALTNVTDEAQIAKSIGTTKGDIIAFSGSATPARLGVGSANQVLTVDSAEATGLKWATPAGGGESENIVRTTGDVSNSTTTFANVTGLTFAMGGANTDYVFEAWLIFQSNTATTGIKFAVNGPASPTALAIQTRIPISLVAVTLGGARAYDSGTASASVDTINSNLLAHVVGIIRNGSNTGTFAIRFAAETTGTVKVMTGSVLRYRQVA